MAGVELTVTPVTDRVSSSSMTISVAHLPAPPRSSETGAALDPERSLAGHSADLQAEPLLALEDEVLQRLDRHRNRHGEHGAVARPVARPHRQLDVHRREVVAGHCRIVRGEHPDLVRPPAASARPPPSSASAWPSRFRPWAPIRPRPPSYCVLRPLRDDRRVHHHHLHRRRVGRRQRRQVFAHRRP